jgi:hypothetical protein
MSCQCVQTAEDEAPGQETATSAADDVPLVSLCLNDAPLPFDTNQELMVLDVTVESSTGRRYVTIESAEGGLHLVLANHPQLVECHHALIDYRLEMTCMDANAPIFDDIMDAIIVKAKPEQLDAEAIHAYRACRQRHGLMSAQQQHLAAAVGDEVYSEDTEESAVVAVETESADVPTVVDVVATAADAGAQDVAVEVDDDDESYLRGFLLVDAAATELEQLQDDANAWVGCQSLHLRYLLLQQATEHGQEEADRLTRVLSRFRHELERIDELLGNLKEPQYSTPLNIGVDEDVYKRMQQFNKDFYTHCPTCKRYFKPPTLSRSHPNGECPGTPGMFELSGPTLVLSLLVGNVARMERYRGEVATDSIQKFLSAGQDGPVATNFLQNRFLPKTELTLRAQSLCGKTMELRREYLKAHPEIIFQEGRAVPVSSDEKRMVRASPTLRTVLNRVQHLYPRRKHERTARRCLFRRTSFKIALSTNKSNGALAAQFVSHWNANRTLEECGAALGRLRGGPSLSHRRAHQVFRICFGESAFWPQPGELAKFSQHVRCGMSRADCEAHRLVTGQLALDTLRNDFAEALARRADAIKVAILGDTTLPQTAASSLLGGFLTVHELSLDVLAQVDVPRKYFFHVPSP